MDAIKNIGKRPTAASRRAMPISLAPIAPSLLKSLAVDDSNVIPTRLASAPPLLMTIRSWSDGSLPVQRATRRPRVKASALETARLEALGAFADAGGASKASLPILAVASHHRRKKRVFILHCLQQATIVFQLSTSLLTSSAVGLPSGTFLIPYRRKAMKAAAARAAAVEAMAEVMVVIEMELFQTVHLSMCVPILLPIHCVLACLLLCVFVCLLFKKLGQRVSKHSNYVLYVDGERARCVSAVCTVVCIVSASGLSCVLTSVNLIDDDAPNKPCNNQPLSICATQSCCSSLFPLCGAVHR